MKQDKVKNALTIRNSLFVVIGKAMSSVLTFLLSIVIARLYGAHIMGLFFLAFTIFSILSMLARLGLDVGIVRFVAIYNSEKKYSHIKGAILESSKIVFFLGLLVGFALYALSSLLAEEIFHNKELTVFLKIFGLILPFFSVWGLLTEALRGLKAFLYLVINQNILFPLGSLLSVLFAFHLRGRESLFLVSAYGFSVLFAGLFAGVYFVLKVFPQAKKVRSFSEMRKILKFSYPLIFVTLISLAIYWVDTLMLGIMRTPEDVAVYTSASKVSLFIVFFLVSIGTMTAPFFAEYLQQGRKNELENLARTVARWTFYGSFPVALSFMFFSREIMDLFGTTFAPGSLPLVYLSIGQIINAATGLVGQILIIAECQYVVARITLFSALLNIVLNLLFIPEWGIAGAAAATGLTISIMNIAFAYAVYRIIGVKAYVDGLPRLVLIAIVPLALCIICRAFLGPYVSGVIFLLSYVIAAVTWGLKEDDKKLLIALLQRMAPKRSSLHLP